MRSFIKDNSLSLALLILFVLSLIGQSLAGWVDFNREQHLQNAPTTDYLKYLLNAHFLEAVFENWESEFLQMAAFVFLTVFLRQKGSPESKPVDGHAAVDKVVMTPQAPWPVKRGGWVLSLYQNSLSLALFLLFLVSFILHAVTGVRKFNTERLAEGNGETLSVLQYMSDAHFWYESFQNWQSEFLSIAVLVVLAIFLRQKGSPESKPVGVPHSENE